MIEQALGMAPIEKKRHRSLASFKAKKRQRIGPKDGDLQGAPKSGAVGLDKLPWNQVAVDRLEDAEGFFGLEELSDVEIVKDPTLGKLEYKVGQERALEDLVLRYTDYPMQLLSNKSTHRRIEQSNTSEHDVRTDEDGWEGFGEDETEKQVDAPRLTGKAPLGKESSMSEKKRRKQEGKKKKRVASQPEVSKNIFEALGSADQDGNIADSEEIDGKRKHMTKKFFCS